MWVYAAGVFTGFIIFPVTYICFMKIVAEDYETHDY